MTKTLIGTPDPDDLPELPIGSKRIFSARPLNSIDELIQDVFSPLTAVQENIVRVCQEVQEMLIAKNRKYGNSAIDPVRIFSNTNAREQIMVRIDDKLNRMANRQSDEDEDIVLDLIGYLVLLRVLDEMNGNL